MHKHNKVTKTTSQEHKRAGIKTLSGATCVLYCTWINENFLSAWRQTDRQTERERQRESLVHSWHKLQFMASSVSTAHIRAQNGVLWSWHCDKSVRHAAGLRSDGLFIYNGYWQTLRKHASFKKNKKKNIIHSLSFECVTKALFKKKKKSNQTASAQISSFPLHFEEHLFVSFTINVIFVKCLNAIWFDKLYVHFKSGLSMWVFFIKPF